MLNVNSLPVGAGRFIVNLIIVLLYELFGGDGVPLVYLVTSVGSGMMQVAVSGRVFHSRY